MVAAAPLAHLRSATIDDVGGILAIIEPLEDQGVLVRRSRERLEMEIERFVVAEHDGMIVGCAALYAFPATRPASWPRWPFIPTSAVKAMARRCCTRSSSAARKLRLSRLFVLTTRTSGWFIERGFVESDPARLPKQSAILQLAAALAGLRKSAGLTRPSGRAHAGPCDNFVLSTLSGIVDGTHGCNASSSAARPRARLPAVSGRAGQAHLENVSKEPGRSGCVSRTMLVNENRLSLADPRARKYLAEQMERHFFGGGADVASGYVPPKD
jgi:N-acetylglutamate synthase-like GNAT family acetyltransferase/Fe-S cluster biosynthesis and repair protein YggX